MRAMFKKRFPPTVNPVSNIGMLIGGQELYTGFLKIIKKLNALSSDQYVPLFDLYKKLEIIPSSLISKKHFYENYKSGIIVGAGAGHDCDDLLEIDGWWLFDLTDKNMINIAVGYEEGYTCFNSTATPDGDTLCETSHARSTSNIKVNPIDFYLADINRCELISIDAEGMGLDVLIGAKETLEKFSPDILVSIYHNWVEYLHIIPFLYDAGYQIECVRTTNPEAHQPHLDLALLCTR